MLTNNDRLVDRPKAKYCGTREKGEGEYDLEMEDLPYSHDGAGADAGNGALAKKFSKSVHECASVEQFSRSITFPGYKVEFEVSSSDEPVVVVVVSARNR